MTGGDDAWKMHYQLLDWLERSNQVLGDRPDPVHGGPARVSQWEAYLQDLDDRRHAVMDALRVVVDLHGPVAHPSDPKGQPYCLHCSGPGEGARVAFPCRTYRQAHTHTAASEGVGAPSVIMRTAPARKGRTPGTRPGPVADPDMIRSVVRTESGDFEFSDGVRWSAEMFPDQESLDVERTRLDLVEELMRAESFGRRMRRTDDVAQAMFGAPLGHLPPHMKDAVEEAVNRAELLIDKEGQTGDRH